MKIKDGGPAFPGTIQYFPDDKNADEQQGMTLREYFAGQAMQGLLANSKLADHIRETGGARGGWIEESAVGWADALIKALEPK
jgi:hypothetical protein